MSFANANLPIQMFVNNYGNTGRTYNAIPFIRAVSDANNQVMLDPATFTFNPGKLRQVKLTYWPILCDVDGSCDANVCNDGEVVEPKQIMFDIDRCTASKVFSVLKENVRLIDNGSWDYSEIARAIVQSMLPSLRRQLATDWLTYLTQLAGLHPDGNATHRITVTNPTNGIVNPIGLNDMRREFSDNGLSEPYIIGGKEVDNWLSMVNIGGLNASGQRIDQMTTRNTWYDQGLLSEILNDEANGDWIFAIAPEVFKYVYYLENAGIFATGAPAATPQVLNTLFQRGTETFLNGVIVDPVTGVPWDFDIYYSPCGKRWNFQMRHNWNFFILPDTACLGQGVNGIMKYRTCPYKIAPCPTGDNPSTIVSPRAFNWTASDVTFTVYRSTIGGIETVLTTPVVIADANDLALYMSNASQIAFTNPTGNVIRYTGFSAIEATFETSQGTITATFA